MAQAQLQAQKTAVPTKSFIKIGSPGYQVRLGRSRWRGGADRRRVQVTKVRDPITGQLGLLFQVHYPQITEGVKPRHRFMSSFEQHVEVPDRAWQYLLVRCPSY